MLDSSEVQMFCSAVLSASTFIYTLKLKCLPILPQIVSPLCSCLTSVNVIELYSIQNIECINDISNSHLSLIQQSILRVFISVLESLPQFMKGYLKTLLTPSCLPS